MHGHVNPEISGFLHSLVVRTIRHANGLYNLDKINSDISAYCTLSGESVVIPPFDDQTSLCVIVTKFTQTHPKIIFNDIYL